MAIHRLLGFTSILKQRGVALKALLFIITLILCACSSKKPVYIPLETVTNDSIRSYNENVMAHLRLLTQEVKAYQSQKDSTRIQEMIYIRDSIVTVQSESGDVLSREHFRDINKQTDAISIFEKNSQTEINRAYIDSLISAQKTELMAVLEKNQQMPVPVEKELSKWEKIRIDSFWYLLGGLLIALTFILRKPIFRIIRNIKLP